MPSPEDDAEALRHRRAGLRAFVEGMAEAVEVLHLPETYLEAERAARTITVADRITCKLGPEAFDGEEGEDDEVPPPARQAGHLPMNGEEEGTDLDARSNGAVGSINATVRVRLGLRRLADRVMEAAILIPMPDCFLEAERAGRYAMACDRMLTQLYAPPKATARLEDDADDDEDQRLSGKAYIPRCKGVYPDDMRAVWADWQFRLEEDILAMQQRDKEAAEKSGFWWDGRPYVPEPDESDEPERYNPDGTVYCNREEVERRIAAKRVAEPGPDAETPVDPTLNPEPQTDATNAEVDLPRTSAPP